jgi:hypothetical protein
LKRFGGDLFRIPRGKEKWRLQKAFEAKIKWKSIQNQNNRFDAFGDGIFVDAFEERIPSVIVGEINNKFLLRRPNIFE